MVGRDRGDAAPVVDAGVEQAPEVVGEVRGRLEVDVVREEEPGGCDRPQVVVLRARLGRVHRRARLGQEVLDDHLLHVAVAAVRGLDGQQRLDALLPGLPEPDEEAGGERDPCPAGRLQRGQAALRRLVGSPEVRPARLAEAGGQRLQHHALRRRDGPEALELGPGQGAGVGVGEEPRLGQHRAGRRHQVVDGRAVATGRQPAGSGGVALLGGLAEGEERFPAPGGPPGPGDGQDLVELQVRGVEPGRGLGEGAVPATVAAQHGERDEHLGGERDPVAVGGVAPAGRLRHEVREGGPEEVVGVEGGGGGHGPTG